MAESRPLVPCKDSRCNMVGCPTCNPVLTPQQRAEVDQFRAAVQKTLDTPCVCDECPPDDDLRHLLAMDDETLWLAMRAIIAKERADGR